MLDRRVFLCSAGTAFAALPPAEKKNEEISPTEDLMREHGVLRRILLVYREGMRRIDENKPAPVAELLDGARLVRKFVEDYHEKDEERFVFPRFRKAGQHVDLVNVLLKQHEAGRALTSQIIQLTNAGALNDASQKRALRQSIEKFVRMYEPHAAREDTVLFPAYRKLLSPKELETTGDEFEGLERQMFGSSKESKP